MPADDHAGGSSLPQHTFSWSDFDDLARGYAEPGVVTKLRRAEQSRRKLLLRALDNTLTKAPDLLGPLSPPDDAWELLERVERAAPDVLDLMLAHPYTGTWIGYLTRLVRKQTAGVGPRWAHAGHLHALAAAAAIRAGIIFDINIPVWDGAAMLPTLGMARLATHEQWAIARVRGDGLRVKISNAADSVTLPRQLSCDATNWWALRHLATQGDLLSLSVSLDDLDPYRGLNEPIPPERLPIADVDRWRALLDGAWHLIARYLPDLAVGFPAGLDCLVPRPANPFHNLSGSTDEAFGSAVVALPSDASDLAATLVHEFHHILLNGLLHLIPMYEPDDHERFYTQWRDDPRPIGGVLQGVYAFFGVTAFWRALAMSNQGPQNPRAQFEFAYWRTGTWRTLQALSGDSSLNDAGQRFVDGITERLGQWQGDAVPADIADLAAAAAADHAAGWRLRHVRPSPNTVADLGEAWLAGTAWPDVTISGKPPAPTPVPDGSWTDARTAMIRESLRNPGRARLREIWHRVPGATAADLAYATRRADDARLGYLTELAADSEQPTSWIGLGLALSARGDSSAGARALLTCPEMVRAVYRWVHTTTGHRPDPEELAVWIGRTVC